MSRRFRHAEHVWQTFRGLRAVALVVESVDNKADVAGVVDQHLATARGLVELAPEGELPAIKAWRRAYAQMGLKPTQYRCAAESLLRRIRTHGDVPQLHPLVDLCNAVSAAHAIPVAAFDLDRIDGNLTVRPATGTEAYLTFSGDIEHPAIGETVYADDAQNAHSRRWVTRQSGRSAISPSTTRALIVAEAVHDTAEADLDSVLNVLVETITTTWGTVPLHHRLTAIEPHIALDSPDGDLGVTAPPASGETR